MVCGLCLGSGCWEEFLPEHIPCLGCQGSGRLRALGSMGQEALLDEPAAEFELDFDQYFVGEVMDEMVALAEASSWAEPADLFRGDAGGTGDHGG